MEPALSQESCSLEGTVCFQVDRGNPGLSFGPLMARPRPQPSSPGSPDTCVQRADVTSPQSLRVPTPVDSGGPSGPPLPSRSVSGSAGWPSVGVGVAARPARGSGLRINNSNKNRTKHMDPLCVCVCGGGHFQKSEANLPSTAWGKRPGLGGEQPHKVRCYIALSQCSHESRDARQAKSVWQWPLRVY